MITAIDTDIFLDILVPNDAFHDVSAAALEHARAAGLLAVSDMIYSELCVHF